MASDVRTLPVGRELTSLRWLGQQVQPMWGGPLDRGQRHTSPDMMRWIELGWIGEVSQPCRGYVLTPAGHAAVAEAERLNPPPARPQDSTFEDLGIRWLQTSPATRILQVRRNGAWVAVPTVRFR